MHPGGLFTRNNLSCHELENYRIISFSHTEEPRRIMEDENSIITSLRSVGPRTSLENSGQEKKKRKSVTVRDIPCEDKNSIITSLRSVGPRTSLDNSGQRTSLGTRKIKFENSLIRDKKKKNP